MNDKNRLSLFRTFLRNESSFDSLFCDKQDYPDYSLYYNTEFADDAVFNHVSLSEHVLLDHAPSSVSYEDIVADITEEARNKGVPASIFVEAFWPQFHAFQKVAIEMGYFFFGKMNIMSKQIAEDGTAQTNALDVIVSETDDVQVWNRAFMKSFSIPPSWENELLRRERAFPKDSTRLLVAYLGNSKGRDADGCLMILVEPRDCAGIYSVGAVPESRSKGIARALMVRAESLSRGLGSKLLTLQTIVSDGYTPMYEKFGFHIDFERDVLKRPNF